MWDNGVDWTDAPNEEGDWVRVYPFARGLKNRNFWTTKMANSRGEKCETDVRAIVTDNVRFYKAVRDCQVKNRGASDDVKDNFMIRNGVCEAVWHPYVS